MNAEHPINSKTFEDNMELIKTRLGQMLLRCIFLKFTKEESLDYIKSNTELTDLSRYDEIKKDITHKIDSEGYRISSEDKLFKQLEKMLLIAKLSERLAEIDYKYETNPKLKSPKIDSLKHSSQHHLQISDSISETVKNKDVTLILTRDNIVEFEIPITPNLPIKKISIYPILEQDLEQ